MEEHSVQLFNHVIDSQRKRESPLIASNQRKCIRILLERENPEITGRRKSGSHSKEKMCTDLIRKRKCIRISLERGNLQGSHMKDKIRISLERENVHGYHWKEEIWISLERENSTLDSTQEAFHSTLKHSLLPFHLCPLSQPILRI